MFGYPMSDKYVMKHHGKHLKIARKREKTHNTYADKLRKSHLGIATKRNKTHNDMVAKARKSGII